MMETLKAEGCVGMQVWGFDVLQVVRVVVDVTLVWYVLYKLIMLIRGTKAIQLLKGIVVVLAVRMASVLFDLQTLKWLTQQAILWGFLVIIILFQPELRRALEQLGRGSLFTRVTKSGDDAFEKTIDSIVESCKYMAKRRIGAIITIERETGIDDYAETGILIGGKLTHQLLTNIFTPNTPLHDGAVIVREDQIIAAACYLPLSESPHISKDLGTRHRASVGISEVTDAITVIVSEETGHISCTKNGELIRDLDEDTLRSYLKENLVATMKSPESKLWNWRGKNNG